MIDACRCEPHAQSSNRCAPCKTEMNRQLNALNRGERPHGNARSPYVRRDSAQLRMSEIDAAIDEMLTVKRKLMQKVRELDAEIECAPTMRSDQPETAPSREVEHVGEI